MRILICEDSALLREGLVRLLEDAGHDVVAALPDATALDETVASGPRRSVHPRRAAAPDLHRRGHPRRAAAAGQPSRRCPCWCCRSTSRSATPPSSSPRSGGALGYLLKDRVADVTDFLAAIDADRRGRDGARPRSRGAAAEPSHPRRADAAPHRAGGVHPRTHRRGQVQPGDRPSAARLARAASRSTSPPSSRSSNSNRTNPATAGCSPHSSTSNTAADTPQTGADR